MRVPDDTSIADVTLRSADVGRSTAFYREIAGLEDLGDGALGWKGEPLVRLTSDGVSGGRAPRAATGLFHTALRYSDRGELGRALVRVLQAGLLTGASDHGVSEALYLDDPDGNGVELYFDRPREVWPPPSAPGDKVGMFTAPLDLEALLAAGQAEPEDGALVDVGHVHLKVSDVERSVEFWSGGLGFEVMARWLDQAAFLAVGGYHHHIGMNTWQSRGAAAGPRELPGLEGVRVRTGAESPVTIEDPDGIRVVLA